MYEHLVVFGIAAAMTAIIFLSGPVYVIISSYVAGRKAGGYPIFAKLRLRRKKENIYDRAYKRGLCTSRNKIAKGGYK